jgi:hypothetical protein
MKIDQKEFDKNCRYIIRNISPCSNWKKGEMIKFIECMLSKWLNKLICYNEITGYNLKG